MVYHFYKEVIAMNISMSVKYARLLPFLALLVLLTGCGEHRLDKPVISSIYTADPSAHVFNGKLYIYPSHDFAKDKYYANQKAGDQYDMDDYHVLSMESIISEAVDNGEALNVKDVPWASRQMWAPDAAYKNGTYFLYFPAKDKSDIFRIGVAKSKSPVGPFMAKSEPIAGSFSIDPAVFTDDDGKTYMLFGGLWGGQLEKWQTGTYNANAEAPVGFIPALGPRIALLDQSMTEIDGQIREIIILDRKGLPLTAVDEDRRFFEGAYLHKYKGVYYLSYSTGTTHFLVYATSTNPLGPYTWRGRLLDPVIGWTTHHSIVEYQGKWYLFYHDASLSNGIDTLRCVKVNELFHENDGSIRKVSHYK
jgi:beta-xylosidase